MARPDPVLLLTLAAGCQTPARAPITVTDSAGVRAVRIGNLNEVEFPAWSTRLLGSSAQQDSVQLGSMFTGGFNADSSFLLTGGSELFVLDRQGRFAGTVGRNGDGPGEFRQAVWLLIAADGTPVVGELTGRLTNIRPTGEALRIIAHLGRGSGTEVAPITMLPDGRVLATRWQERPNRGEMPGILQGAVERDSAPLVVHDSMGQARSRLGLWLGVERAMVRIDDEPSRLPVRFARSVAADGRGSLTVIGPTDSLDFSLYDGTSLVLRLIGGQPTSRPNPQIIADWERTVREQDPDVAASYLRAIESAPEVDRLPAIGGVVVDDAGNLWVGDCAVVSGSRRWRVFSRSGQPVGQLGLPAFNHSFVPGTWELLDVYGDRLAVRRRLPTGEIVVELLVLRRGISDRKGIRFRKWGLTVAG